MRSEHQEPSEAPAAPDNHARTEQDRTAESSSEKLMDELERLGRKFLEVIELAWSSDERRQIEQDLRSGLNNVAESLESGLRDISEREQTKELVGRAENLADSVAEKVRTSEFANELAVTLAKGLRSMGDQLDQLSREMHQRKPATHRQSEASENEDADESTEIPIESEPPSSSSDEQ